MQSKAAPLTEAEQEQLAFFRNRGATFLLTAAVAKCIETIPDRAVPNTFRASFGQHTSPDKAQSLWTPIVEATLPFCTCLVPAVTNGLKNRDEATKVIATFKTLVEATKKGNAGLYSDFARHVSIK